MHPVWGLEESPLSVAPTFSEGQASLGLKGRRDRHRHGDGGVVSKMAASSVGRHGYGAASVRGQPLGATPLRRRK